MVPVTVGLYGAFSVKTIWLDKNQIFPYRIGHWNGVIDGFLFGVFNVLIIFILIAL